MNNTWTIGIGLMAFSGAGHIWVDSGLGMFAFGPPCLLFALAFMVTAVTHAIETEGKQ